MQELRKRFGRLLAAHRRRVGMTQDSLATASGVSPDMIARMEAGATGARFHTIVKLSAALGIDPAELFTHELPTSALERSSLTAVIARLSTLSDKDLAWVDALLDVALKRR